MKTVENELDSKNIVFFEQTTLSSIRGINKLMRDRDDSHLYPICGHFNATDRAIRWFSRVYFPANGPCSNLEYALGLDAKISEYVNTY